jgi:hypothetical protein
VSTDAEASNVASLQVDTPVATDKNSTANTASAAFEEVDTPVATAKATITNTPPTEHEESIESIGKMIRDLFHSDNAKVNAALAALHLHLNKDKKRNAKASLQLEDAMLLFNYWRRALTRRLTEV